MGRSREHLLDPEIRAIVRRSFRVKSLQDKREQIDAEIRLALRTRRWHVIEQTLIFVLSITAMALVVHAESITLKWWGNVIGLASQPLWFISAWRHRQWGIFINAFFFAGVWTSGVVRYF